MEFDQQNIDTHKKNFKVAKGEIQGDRGHIWAGGVGAFKYGSYWTVPATLTEVNEVVPHLPTIPADFTATGYTASEEFSHIFSGYRTDSAFSQKKNNFANSF